MWLLQAANTKSTLNPKSVILDGEVIVSLPLLLVDDNVDILYNIRDYLIIKGYSVETAINGADALERLKSGSYCLCVLDIGLPLVDGLTICQHLRREGNTIPILMLTARDSIDDRVRGLEVGADDYLIKPFALKELAARIEALLRRSYGAPKDVLQVGDLVFNVKTLQVSRADTPIHLNPTCLSILKELMAKSPAVVSRSRLETVVWNGSPPDSDSLRANLYLLRRAVDKPFDKALIKTHPGMGWSLSE